MGVPWSPTPSASVHRGQASRSDSGSDCGSLSSISRMAVDAVAYPRRSGECSRGRGVGGAKPSDVAALPAFGGIKRLLATHKGPSTTVSVSPSLWHRHIE